MPWRGNPIVFLLAAYFTTPRLILWPFLGAAVGVYLFYRGFLLLARRRLILNTPASKTRSAALGLVELSGLAVGPYTVTAPITGTFCYYYRSTVWEWKRSGRSSSWQIVANESLHVPFYLDDNTGRVLVDPQGADVDIHRDFHEQYNQSFFSNYSDLPAGVSNFLARHGVSPEHNLKVEEYCIKPKNALFVLGTLRENPGLSVSPDPVQNQTASEHTLSIGKTSIRFSAGTSAEAAIDADMPQEVIWLSPQNNPESSAEMTSQGKIAAAMMKAGITSPAAWSAAGVQYPGSAAVTSTAAANSAADFDLHPKTVLMKGDHNSAFLISWRSQREVVQSLGWKSVLMIWGGPALALFSLYILALEFKWV
jgi:E3 Ubiquitin ligase